MLRYSLLAVALFGTAAAHADVVTIPSESGFSGFVMGGAGFQNYQSNFYKGRGGDDHHDGLHSSPQSQSNLVPLINADLRYTFGDSRTQLFLGNLIQDAVRFDFTQQAGVRQQIGDKGILSAGYVFSGVPVKTWKDPYASGSRSETDIKSKGARFGWDQVWGTGLNASYTYRKVDVDSEESGAEWAGGDTQKQAQANMLDRNGTIHRYELSYDIRLQPKQTLSPTIIYSKADLDGSAESYDRTQLQLSYAYQGAQWSLTSNVFAAQRNYDTENPIYNQQADADEYGLNATFFWHQLMGVKPLSGFVSASYAKSNSDIAFYDTQVSSVGTGLIYNF